MNIHRNVQGKTRKPPPHPDSGDTAAVLRRPPAPLYPENTLLLPIQSPFSPLFEYEACSPQILKTKPRSNLKTTISKPQKTCPFAIFRPLTSHYTNLSCLGSLPYKHEFEKRTRKPKPRNTSEKTFTDLCSLISCLCCSLFLSDKEPKNRTLLSEFRGVLIGSNFSFSFVRVGFFFCKWVGFG